MNTLKFGFIIVIVASAFGFMSCGRSGGTLSSIIISPAHPTIIYGTPKQFTATAIFSNGTTIDWTSASVWSTSSSTIATIGNSLGTYGLSTSASCTTGCATSTVTITATDTVNNISGSTTLHITTPQSVAITPTNPYMENGKTHQFKATATLPDLSTGASTTATITQDITTYATWTTMNTDIATISNLGLVTASPTNTGSTGIIMSDPTGSTSSATTLTVTDTALDSLDIMPPDVLIISTGTTTQFTAQGTFKDNPTPVDITASVSWHSSNTNILTVGDEAGTYGLVTAVSPGKATIKATDPITGKSKSVAITVQ
jgi:hypothetical protein